MSESRNLALGSDHAGYYLKEFIKKELIAQGYEIEDFGFYHLKVWIIRILFILWPWQAMMGRKKRELFFVELG